MDFKKTLWNYFQPSFALFSFGPNLAKPDKSTEPQE